MHAISLERPWRLDAQAAGTVGLAHLTSHFFQFLLPPIYPWLMRDFGIGFTEAGFLATVFFVISSTGQALAGFAVDRFGAFRVLQLGVAVLACAGIMLGLSHSYVGLVATAAIAGMGNAIFHPADFTILNRRVSPSRLGHAFAMHGLSGNLGWVAGSSFMATVTSLTNWHLAGFGAAALGLASLAFLSFQRSVLEGPNGPAMVQAPAQVRAQVPAQVPAQAVAEPAMDARVDAPMNSGLGNAAKTGAYTATASGHASAVVGAPGQKTPANLTSHAPLEAPAAPPAQAPASALGQFAFLGSGTVWMCFAFFFLSTGAGGILQNFAPAMLSHVYSVTAVFGTLCLTSYLLGSAAGTVLGGFVAGRQRRSALVVASALCIAATLSLLLASALLAPWALPAALFALGCGTGTAGPSRDLLVRQAATSRFGANSFGRVYGFVYAGLDSGLAIAPLLVGRILDQGMFRAGLLCIAGLQVCAVFVALRVGRRV